MALIGLDSGRDFERLRRVVRFVEGLMGGPPPPRTRTPPGGPPVHFVKPTSPPDGDGFASALLQYWDSDSETWQDDGEVVFREANGGTVTVGNKYLARGVGEKDGLALFQAHAAGGGGSAEPGCGLYLDDGGNLAVDAEAMVGWGNTGINWTADKCGFYLKPACGIELGVNGDGEQTVGVQVADLAGPGLAAGSGCSLTIRLPALGGLLVINGSNELVVNDDWLDDELGPANCVEVVTDVTCEDNKLAVTTKHLAGRFRACDEEPDPCPAGGC